MTDTKSNKTLHDVYTKEDVEKYCEEVNNFFNSMVTKYKGEHANVTLHMMGMMFVRGVLAQYDAHGDKGRDAFFLNQASITKFFLDMGVIADVLPDREMMS